MLYRALFTGQRPCCLLPGPFPHTTFHLVSFLSFQSASCHVVQLKRYDVEMSFFPAHALTTQLTFGCLAVYCVTHFLYPQWPPLHEGAFPVSIFLGVSH